MINLTDQLTAKTVQNILGESKEIAYQYGDENMRVSGTVATTLNRYHDQIMEGVVLGDQIAGPGATDWQQGTVEQYIDDRIHAQDVAINEKLALQQDKINTLNGNEVVMCDTTSDRPATGSVGIIYRVSNDPDAHHYTDYMWDLKTNSYKTLATYEFPGIDDKPTKNSDNLVSSGGVFDEITTNGSAFDVTAYYSGTTYSGLTQALNAVLSDYRKGGMSVKYVQSSDNKYVQYRLKSTNFSTDTEDWEQSTTGLTVPLITWSALKALRDGGNLVAGQWYRITDYVTTTVQEDTQSAGHQFDIIVRADSSNVLNENAYAAIHSGDTYFANSNLAAWKLKYCLDNISWSSEDSSERYITFIYYNTTVKANYVGTVTINYQTYYKWEAPARIGPDQFVYSTSCNVGSTLYYYYNNNIGELNLTISQYNEGGQPGTGTIIYLKDEFDNECPYDFKNIQFKESTNYYYTFDYNTSDYSLRGNYCYGNNIRRHISNSEQRLNFIVIKISNMNSSCHSNTFGNNCHNIYFGNNSFNNTFGSNCYDNTFGNNCNSNTFGKNCNSNTFGDGFIGNTVGCRCIGYNFGNNCLYNTFGNNVQNINISKDFFAYNIIENGNKDINITSSQTTSSSNMLQNITIAQGVNNTSTFKTISHNTVNDTFQTIYQPANSQVVNV